MDLDAEHQIVQKYYKLVVTGARSDAEELHRARKMLEGAHKGEVPDDDGDSLCIIEPDLDLPVEADFLLEEETPQQRLRQALPLIAAAVLAAIFALFAYGGEEKTPPAATASPTPAAITLATRTLTPLPAMPSTTPQPSDTPTITPSPLPTLTATPAPPEEVEVKPEPVDLEPGAVIPLSIEIAGRYFPIVPTTLRDDAWAYVPDGDRVSWLAGSRVNVVLGLPYDEANQDFLAATLAMSDTLTLRDSVGQARAYRVVERRQVSVYETEVLGQQRVGLTLLLLGGNAEASDHRLAILARPAEEKEVNPTRDGE
jgi:hypothetical protein